MAELKIKADSGGGTVSLKGPSTTTSNAAVQLTLPVDDGTTGQYLKTDGSGALSWATVASPGGATGTDYNDDVKVRFGTGNDLDIHHDGSDSYIKNATGHLRIYGSGTADKHIYLQPDNGDNGVIVQNDGPVSLYHSNSKKAETSSTGFDVTGFVNLVNNNTGLKTTAGNLKLYSTTGQIGFQTDANHVILAEATDSSSYSNGLLQSYCHRATTNGTYNLAHFYSGGFGGQFKVADSGNCTNSNNSYGSTSDERLKQDIVDAASQWNDIKGLRVRKFRWKAAPTAPLSIGLVAQEAETVSPGLVENTGVEEQDSNGHAQPKFDADGNRETVKTLKYSVLYMKAIKCLQEAQARIETLETKVAALEAG